ncbi:hypothetical protein [Pedobacter sp.]
MKKVALILVIIVSLASCRKEEEFEPEVEQKAAVETRASFYLSKEDQNYWVRNVTVAGKEIGGVVSTSFNCDIFDTRYLLSDSDLNKTELQIILLYNYYPTNIFGRQITFNIPVNRFKKGVCTPVEIQQQSAGILQLYIKP